MIEIIVIAAFVIIIWREIRKEDKDPSYRSWMTRGDSHWDHWNHTKYGD